MGRWFGAPSHPADNEVKRSIIIRGPRHQTMKHTLVPRRIGLTPAISCRPSVFSIVVRLTGLFGSCRF